MSEVKTDKISSVSTNGDITLDPDGTGDVLITGALRQSTSQAVVTELSAVGFTTGSTWVSLGKVAIPQSGIWFVRADIRLRSSGTGFIKARLGTTSSGGEIGSNGGGGANTAIRMLEEQVEHTGSFFNMHIAPSWILDVPTGLTFPDDVYLHVQSNSSDSQNLNNNDANGHPTLSCFRINGTTTTGTTIETIGGA